MQSCISRVIWPKAINVPIPFDSSQIIQLMPSPANDITEHKQELSEQCRPTDSCVDDTGTKTVVGVIWHCRTRAPNISLTSALIPISPPMGQTRHLSSITVLLKAHRFTPFIAPSGAFLFLFPSWLPEQPAFRLGLRRKPHPHRRLKLWPIRCLLAYHAAPVSAVAQITIPRCGTWLRYQFVGSGRVTVCQAPVTQRHAGQKFSIFAPIRLLCG